MARHTLTSLYAKIPVERRKFIQEVVSFGLVGGTAFIVDSLVYLALRRPDWFEAFGMPVTTVFAEKPVLAKIISVAVATVVAWLGNRFITYKDRTSRQTSASKEFRDFAIINVLGLMIGAGCVFFSHYILGFQSVRADFIAGNVVGLVLGTIFRFVAYRMWLFPEETPQPAPQVPAPTWKADTGSGPMVGVADR